MKKILVALSLLLMACGVSSTSSGSFELVATPTVTATKTQVTIATNKPAQTPTPHMITTVGNWNIRSGAGFEFSKITDVTSGTPLIVIATSGDWYQVQVNGFTGYIKSRCCR